MTETTKRDERETLLPCPFCGSRLTGLDYTGQPARQIFASCFDCRATGPAQQFSTGMTFDWDAAWNRRAALATAPEQAGEPVKAIVEALEETQGLLAAMLHESRPTEEIATQLGDNRTALQAYYTAPPPASTNRLTEEQIAFIYCPVRPFDAIAFARAIIAATEGK